MNLRIFASWSLGFFITFVVIIKEKDMREQSNFELPFSVK